MKILFINDNADWLNAIKRNFDKKVVTALCRSTNEAHKAIRQNEPEIIFLDHSLTEGGSEGVEVAKWARENTDARLICNSASHCNLRFYEEAGIEIEYVSPNDLKKMKMIIGE